MSQDERERAGVDTRDVEAATAFVESLRPSCTCTPVTVAADAYGFACFTCGASMREAA